MFAQLAGNQSALNPHGSQADALAAMSWMYLIGGLVVWFLVMCFLAVALLRSRKGKLLGETGSWRLLIWAGTAIPAIVLMAFLIHSVIVGQKLHAKGDRMDDALRVRVVGKQWWWDIYYLDGQRPIARLANEIHVPVGRRVVFELETHDVIHSFWVPSLGGKMDLIPGRKNRVWLQADKPGIFRGQCAEYCGAQHAHMAFEVVAEPPEQFARWLTWQASPAAMPTSAAAMRGHEVFVAGPCALCHAVRGTTADAQFGPDLTHVAGRRWIAAATLPHNRGSLAGWIANAQGIKPGNSMPKMNMSAQDLQSLTDYLGGLR